MLILHREFYQPELSSGCQAQLLGEARAEVQEGKLEQSVEHSRPRNQLLHLVEADILHLFQDLLVSTLDHVQLWENTCYFVITRGYHVQHQSGTATVIIRITLCIEVISVESISHNIFLGLHNAVYLL